MRCRKNQRLVGTGAGNRTGMTEDTTPLAIPLAIVVKCWPRLSETFVAQELAALEAQGQKFQIWSLRHPALSLIHI